ncbi:hypothetical protein [Amycolatopsis thermoflava]|uniref:hypothetical protein n=1 Tax=Amycolatopsis thermoflava TaxID=84480 RepID=UPI00041E2D15|nr:hypothetical protein [Amycolatopsis thermoflava]
MTPHGNHLETFAKIIGQLKTPLTLAGLAVVILYLLYQQVLNLSVLSPLQGNDTFTLVDSIVSKVFWLAVVAVVFGFAGFVLTALLPRRTRPKQAVVSLVGTSLDPELSSPAANPATGNRYEVLEQKFEVGAIDCKFVNRGNATAFLDSFSVLVKGRRTSGRSSPTTSAGTSASTSRTCPAVTAHASSGTSATSALSRRRRRCRSASP